MLLVIAIVLMNVVTVGVGYKLGKEAGLDKAPIMPNNSDFLQFKVVYDKTEGGYVQRIYRKLDSRDELYFELYQYRKDLK